MKPEFPAVTVDSRTPTNLATLEAVSARARKTELPTWRTICPADWVVASPLVKSIAPMLKNPFLNSDGKNQITVVFYI
jgi:hypothetical protein